MKTLLTSLLCLLIACVDEGEDVALSLDGEATLSAELDDIALGADEVSLHSPRAAKDIPLPPSTSAYADCPPGEICFYTGYNGSGKRCSWYAHDTDWASGSTTCSWALSSNVCSVYNRTSRRVEYFREANYVSRIGSTLSGVAGNLACNYKIRSHRFQ